ncbi:MAG: hypothetical protein PHW01_01445 [Patescibacteria group bacterium]|nr:hypothetical protein [Patescibacteria group bacterium]
MEERLQKVPALKIVLSIFFVIVLTGLPILHISHAPRIEINPIKKVVNSIVVAIAFILTYGIGFVVIIKDIINKFRRKKVNNESFFVIWILFCVGVPILYMLLGTIWGRLDLSALFDW